MNPNYFGRYHNWSRISSCSRDANLCKNCNTHTYIVPNNHRKSWWILEKMPHSVTKKYLLDHSDQWEFILKIRQTWHNFLKLHILFQLLKENISDNLYLKKSFHIVRKCLALSSLPKSFLGQWQSECIAIDHSLIAMAMEQFMSFQWIHMTMTCCVASANIIDYHIISTSQTVTNSMQASDFNI